MGRRIPAISMVGWLRPLNPNYEYKTKNYSSVYNVMLKFHCMGASSKSGTVFRL